MTTSTSDRGAETIRRIRATTGLSQRAFAELVGTSGPTVASYERATKEPRLSTLGRMAEAANLRIEIRLAPSDPGASQRARREQRSLALAAATARKVQSDFPTARRLARDNLAKMELTVGDNNARRWIEHWQTLLDGGPSAACSMLVERSSYGHDMRQMSPFAGLLDEDERNAVLAAADALCSSDELP